MNMVGEVPLIYFWMPKNKVCKVHCDGAKAATLISTILAFGGELSLIICPVLVYNELNQNVIRYPIC